MKKKIIFILATVLTIFAISCFLFLKPNCKNHECLNFPEKEKWQIQKTTKNTKEKWQGVFQHPEYQVRLEIYNNISKTQADKFTKIRLTQINGLFNAARSPYPGVLSDEIVCDAKYIPETKTLKTKTGIKVQYLSSFLTKRYQYGACINNQIQYTTQTAFFYCSNTNQWYQLEILQNWDKKSYNPVNQKILQNFSEISCKPTR